MVLVVLAVLVVLGAGGWYFSGVIHADALEVDHGEPARGLVLAPEGEDRVRVSGGEDVAGDLETLADRSTYGLDWESGFGQVAGPAKVEGDEVLRELTVLDGTAPADGTAALLDRDAFPETDPSIAVGVPVEEVVVDSAVGDLPAWFAPGDRGTWAVLVHGRAADRGEMLRMMRSTVAVGLPSLDIGYRNDEDAPQDASGQYGFGATEWQDLDAAVRYAQEQGAEDVVLVGASMGGGIVASYLREVPDAPVAGVVLDSPMLDFGETISFGARQRSFPVWGHVPEPLTWVAKRLTTLRYGVDWEAVDYLDGDDWLDVPALVLHGTADTTVPITLSERLAEQHPDLVDLVVSPDAGHVESWNLDPDGYDAALRQFLTEVVTD